MKWRFYKKAVKPRKLDKNFRKPKLAIKNIAEPKPRPNPSKTAFKETEAKAEANNFWMLGSRSQPGSQHFREKPGFRKPKTASNPTLPLVHRRKGVLLVHCVEKIFSHHYSETPLLWDRLWPFVNSDFIHCVNGETVKGTDVKLTHLSPNSPHKRYFISTFSNDPCLKCKHSC